MSEPSGISGCGKSFFFFEKRKDNCFKNYEVLRVLIKYNGITGNSIEENIKFYRVVGVIPPKNYV